MMAARVSLGVALIKLSVFMSCTGSCWRPHSTRDRPHRNRLADTPCQRFTARRAIGPQFVSGALRREANERGQKAREKLENRLAQMALALPGEAWRGQSRWIQSQNHWKYY